MKLYAYTYQYDRIKKEGYKSLALINRNDPTFADRIAVHADNTGSDNPKDIWAYLEGTFPGRTKSVCAITSPAPVQVYNHNYLNYLIHHADLVSFDVDRLWQDGLIEAIYCKDMRETILKDYFFENIYPIKTPDEIDREPLDWSLCEKRPYFHRSPWAAIKHYFLVLKDGRIPPEYITLETDNSKKREKT